MTGCLNVNIVFSHPSTVVQCSSCSTVLSQPTGGKGRLTEGAVLTQGDDSCLFTSNLHSHQDVLSVERTKHTLVFISVLFLRSSISYESRLPPKSPSSPCSLLVYLCFLPSTSTVTRFLASFVTCLWSSHCHLD